MTSAPKTTSRTHQDPQRPEARPPRRHGANLTRAIYLATLAELAETSFEELSFDKIAARAGAGKASLYRRWNTPAELVLQALTDPCAGYADIVHPHTGSVRDDLTAVLTDFARVLDEPHGQALRPLMTQRPRHPDLYNQVHQLVVQERLDILLSVLQAGAERGEVDPAAVTPQIAAVGQRLVSAEHMERGTITDRDIDSIVTHVLMPLLAPRDSRKG
ncbi:TetR/AcrR family transcriptional regulator [Streptomyces sp. NPDC102360]|uniref:TetR/AcrR family transcriptional regulator n=1 Tax=Streptomyces sp. NPDC102360 TaxID=3366160 RepID=UPI003808686C